MRVDVERGASDQLKPFLPCRAHDFNCVPDRHAPPQFPVNDHNGISCKARNPFQQDLLERRCYSQHVKKSLELMFIPVLCLVIVEPSSLFVWDNGTEASSTAVCSTQLETHLLLLHE